MTRPFVYEGGEGVLQIQEGGYASRAFVDEGAGEEKAHPFFGTYREEIDVIELAAKHFSDGDAVELISGAKSVRDVVLGHFRITIEKL